MKTVLEGLGEFLLGRAVINSLMAGVVILIIASILGKLHHPKI